VTLVWLIGLLLAGGVVAWGGERFGSAWPRSIAVTVMLIALVMVLGLWSGAATGVVTPGGPWIAHVEADWIPRFGIAFHFGADGLSLVLVVLTIILGFAAVIAANIDVKERVGFFHFNLLWTLAGAVGVFTALDLFLFFVFWEAMLIPMALIIALWGHEKRRAAALKFVLFTQGSGLLLFAAILALVFAHYGDTGLWTFDYLTLLAAEGSWPGNLWILLGFVIAFAVKLPMVPLHSWLPDAHTEAPTAGSVVLAGVLLKTGGYGLIRFTAPLFPEAAQLLAPYAMALGVFGILYGAVLAYAQSDFKRLVAYSSVSHMGFVLLGVFAATLWSLQGAVIQMLAHGLSTGGLFIMAGLLQHRLGTRDMQRFGGLWAGMPRLGALTLIFAVAALGLPGLANFVGEFLVLLGTWERSVWAAAFAALGMVGAVIYALALIQRTFHGAPHGNPGVRDLDPRAVGLLAVLVLLLAGLGLAPQPVLDTTAPALEALLRLSEPAILAGEVASHGL
jgi:NADH-quinone oxidoreductase subunit M